MSTHNICSQGEIRKKNQHFLAIQSTLSMAICKSSSMYWVIFGPSYEKNMVLWS